MILSTLQGLADTGFKAEHIEASLNTLEFRFREFSTDADTPKYAYKPGGGVTPPLKWSVLTAIDVAGIGMCHVAFCRGLSLFLAATPQWVYGRPLFVEFEFEAVLTKLRKQYVGSHACEIRPLDVET